MEEQGARALGGRLGRKWLCSVIGLSQSEAAPPPRPWLNPDSQACLLSAFGPAALNTFPAVFYGACISKGKIHCSPLTADGVTAAPLA